MTNSKNQPPERSFLSRYGVHFLVALIVILSIALIVCGLDVQGVF